MASQHKSIFILGGQSNMSGRGGVIHNIWDGVIPAKSRPNPAILRLNAGLEWVEAKEPLHRDIDVEATCGVGPGMAFANSVLSKDPSKNIKVVGLVPCAIGGRAGTEISEWTKGTKYYNQLVGRAEAAMVGGGKILALLWYQGESDATTREQAESYGRKLEKFFSDLRNDLHSPMLPIIEVALASGNGPYMEDVRKVQFAMSKHVRMVRCVDAKGLQLEPDGLHLTTPAQVHLGNMLADAFLKPWPRSALNSKY